MSSSNLYAISKTVAASVYIVVSLYLFDQVYKTSKCVIDELFHIPQGIEYCNRNFTHWDPKITTLPGLYLATTLFISSFLDCDVYNLRFLNLIGSVVNFFLLSSIIRFIFGRSSLSSIAIVLQALNLAILPPLYFFSHLYYTETLSLTCLLVIFRLSLENKWKLLIFTFGILSILMRQTNIVWIAMIFGHKILDVFIKSSRVYGNQYISKTSLNYSNYAHMIDKAKLKPYYDLNDFIQAVRFQLVNKGKPFFNTLTFADFQILVLHGLILASFVVFIFVNGSIVVGDKSAHNPTLHITQSLYFLLFYGVFGAPYVLTNLPSTLKLMWNSKIKVVSFLILFLVIVHFNTIEHKYLLADNRHYTFYIWHRWFKAYWFAKYLTVLAYVFLLFSLYDILKDQNSISFLLPFTICTVVVLSLQSMIEVRYFLVPYLILRLRFVKASWFVTVLEFLMYVAINAVTFNLFFTKEIIWTDFDDIQRIIW